MCVTRVYCDNKTEVRIRRFSHKSSLRYYFQHGKFKGKIWRDSLIGGLKLGWGDFWLRGAIFWKRCEIELRWQFIESHIYGLSNATNVDDLEWPTTSIVVSVMPVVTKRLRQESRGFHCKVALYLSCLHFKLDDKIIEISSNFKHNFGLAYAQS